MKTTLIITAVILSLCSSSFFAQELISDKLTLKDSEIYPEPVNTKFKSFVTRGIALSRNQFRKMDLTNDANSGRNISGLDMFAVKDNVNAKETGEKSVLLGTALSALLPGAGEFYAKSYLKAGIFFGVELLSWGAFALFQIKGDDQTDKFQTYADQYWSVRQYAQWLVDEQFTGYSVINPNEPDREVLRLQIMECERQNFSHTLPEFGSQQFYELIGKYQNFQAGWTNLAHVPTKNQGPYWYETYKDPVFVNYANERQLANDYYNYAKTGIIVVVLNHILSAADAAWTVSMFNKELKMETGLEIKRYRSPYTLEVGNMPVLNLRVSF